MQSFRVQQNEVHNDQRKEIVKLQGRIYQSRRRRVEFADILQGFYYLRKLILHFTWLSQWVSQASGMLVDLSGHTELLSSSTSRDDF